MSIFSREARCTKLDTIREGVASAQRVYDRRVQGAMLIARRSLVETTLRLARPAIATRTAMVGLAALAAFVGSSSAHHLRDSDEVERIVTVALANQDKPAVC